jgi:hypothetical protein
MRILDLLTEAKLKPADFYMKDRLEVLINRLKNNQPFINDKTQEKVYIKPTRQELAHLQKVLDYFNKLGKTSITKDQITKMIPSSIGGVSLNTLFKDNELGGKGGVKGDSSVEYNKDLGNVGPAVETWKAIALFAKLTHRGNETITMELLNNIKDAVEKTVQYSKKSKGGVETAVLKKLVSVPDFTGNVSDTISIKIDVGLGSFQRAMAASPKDPDLWGRIQAILRFVNENNALNRYNKIFSTNGRVDPIKVAVVGGAGEKTDVQTSYLDPQGNKKPLSSLTFSLKAGSNKLGQSSGTTIEGVKSMFKVLGLGEHEATQAITDSGFLEKARAKKADAPETDEQITARYQAIVQIFGVAAEKLNAKLRNASDTGEKAFLQNFFTQVKNQFTGGTNMISVDFNANGTYTKFNPHVISDLVNHVDLESTLQVKKRPTLKIFDKISNTNLIQIRLEAQSGGRLTFHVELESKFKELANQASQAERASAKAAKKPAPVAVAPKKIANPTLGVANQNLALNKSKAPMGQEEPVDDIRFSGE